VEEKVLMLRLGIEGLGQRMVGDVGLLVKEPAADFMLPSQLHDRLSPDEGRDSQILTLRREQSQSRPARKTG
jgi:hypothetical protein